MSISENIKKIRENQNLSQKEFAEMLGVTDKAVSTWENDINLPRMGIIQKISDIFGIKKSVILDEDPTLGRLAFVDGKSSKGIKIPVLGRIAAGIPIEAQEEIIDWEEISEEMSKSGDYFALKTKGDSMLPKIEDKDVLIVRKQPTVENGQIGIVIVNGTDGTVKKVMFNNDGITLMPLNIQGGHNPTFFNHKEIEELPVRIIGRVIEVRKTL